MDITPDITDSSIESANAWGRNPQLDPALYCPACHTAYLMSEGLAYCHSEWRCRCPYCFRFLRVAN